MTEKYTGAVKVKVCGITLLEQTVAMSQMGVDYLGFNFWDQSKRFISIEKAKEMARVLKQSGKTESVGIFVDQPLEEVQKVAQEVGLDWVQLHGSEPMSYVEALKERNLSIIKALPAQKEIFETWFTQKVASSEDDPNYWLFDTASATQFGGVGQVFDWSLLKHPRVSLKSYFLAGGLGPHNLQEALNKTSPYAVDLNSKVEVSPGVKDMDLVQKSLDIVKEWNRESLNCKL
jgi:phosphoribosylanthranilate isomerase